MARVETPFGRPWTSYSTGSHLQMLWASSPQFKGKALWSACGRAGGEQFGGFAV